MPHRLKKNMDNKQYWSDFYDKHYYLTPSSFAKFVLPWVKKGILVDFGCGDGRDSKYFRQQGKEVIGVDNASNFDVKMTVEDYLDKKICPEYVYARFFWHAISRELQLAILDWTTDYIFIEARTINDEYTIKTFNEHDRNYVSTAQLVSDLKERGFVIDYLTEGRGLSKYKTEDPFLVRVIAHK